MVKGKAKKKDPNAPKKPKSAYFLFCDDHRENIKKEHPDSKSTEIQKHISKLWSDLDEAKKEDYKEKAKKLMAKHKIEFDTYKKNKPESESDDGSDSDQKGKKKRKRKVKKDPNAPKKPLTAYFLFLADTRQQMKKDYPDLKVTELSKKAGAAWKELGTAKKEDYNKKAKKLKEAYEITIKEYNEKKAANAEESEEEQQPKKKKRKPAKKQESSDDESEEDESDSESE